MRANVRGFTWERISRLRRMRRAQNIATLGLVILGPFMALLTFRPALNWQEPSAK